MKRISAIALVILLLSLLVTAVSANVISLENSQVNAIGDSAAVTMVLDAAPNGLAGYSITVTVQDPSVATITAAGFPGWATMKDNSVLPASSVSMKAADLGEQIQAGATSIPLGTVTLQGLKAGSTTLTATVTRMNDDADARITPTIQSGTFTVTVPSTPTPTPTTATPTPTTTITISPTPTTTQTPAPVAGFSASPTSGTAPLEVQFTDLSTGDGITDWSWDFNNDGVIDSTEQDPLHTFDTAGSYSVKLTVTGTGGDGQVTRSNYITATASPTPTQTPTPTPTTTQPPAHTVPSVTADVSGNTVVMNWERIADTDFSGYKVVVSKNNPNPAYPGDGYMFWITSRDTVTATLDASNAYNGGDFGGKLKPGETYYFSVTALYNDNAKVPGNVIQLTFPGGATPTPTPTSVPAPVGAFTANPLSGTAPLTVQFTDASTGQITSWLWDADNDGTVDCTTKDCSFTFANAGTYTVKLTVSGDGGFDNVLRTGYISVTAAPTPTPTQVPAPVAGFSGTPVSGMAPLTVSFTDASTGMVADYAWDFNNDGVIDSTQKNPTYTYATPGTFTTKLIVTGTGGSDDETKTDYITVTASPTPTPVPAPVAQFSGTPTSGYAPLTVQFTDESTGTYTAIYWDFNNDMQPDSVLKNPSYTFTQPGNYTVNMAITGPGGLDYEIKPRYITVTAEPIPAPVAQFSAQPTSGDAPLTVQFTDASIGSITAYAWDFENDGIAESIEKSPSHIYSLPGTYAVNLTVTGPGGADGETRPAFITVTQPLAKPVANFTADPVKGVAPLNVQFTDSSSGTGISTWAWDFNSDGIVDSAVQNPVHVFNQTGVHTISLAVTNAAGTDTKTETGLITVTEPAPVAQFSAEPLSGTIPLKVNFTDNSTNAASFAWDFENDGIIDSTEKNPEHVYTKAGSYTVNLTVANSAATSSEIKTAYITAKISAPKAEFSADPLSGTAPLKVNFTDASTGDSINAWAWDFNNDGVVDSIVQHPQYEYNVPGVYNVSLQVTNAGGSHAITKEQYITATMVAPLANFTANQTSGYAPLPVEFTDISTGTVASRSWDFENDGIVDSTEKVAVHTYTAAGNYTVNFTASNAGGSSKSVKTDFIIVKAVPAPVVEFSANLTAGMVPHTVQFTDESKGTGLINWSWDFNNDGTVDSTDQNPVYTYANPGNYSVSLNVKGTGGFTKTTKADYILVSAVPPAAPKAEFVAKPTSGKAPLVVKFTDKSVGKNITAWSWDFNGDGVTDSIEQNPSYTYTGKGTYNVSLTVKNAGGPDTQFKKNYIKVSQLEKPAADFKADKQSGNAPLTVKFTDTSKGDSITEWSWDFNNDGIIDSTEKNPSFTYSAAGKYAVKLVVTNAAGSDMEVRSDFITVKGSTQPPAGKKPIAVIFADKTWGTPPMSVKFADQSLNNPASRTWFFGDGTSSTEKNPTHFYADPGIYFARLYVENGAGTDQDFRFIFVLPPWLGMWSGR